MIAPIAAMKIPLMRIRISAMRDNTNPAVGFSSAKGFPSDADARIRA